MALTAVLLLALSSFRPSTSMDGGVAWQVLWWCAWAVAGLCALLLHQLTNWRRAAILIGGTLSCLSLCAWIPLFVVHGAQQDWLATVACLTLLAILLPHGMSLKLNLTLTCVVIALPALAAWTSNAMFRNAFQSLLAGLVLLALGGVAQTLLAHRYVTQYVAERARESADRHDALTGLLNRAAFMLECRQEMLRCQRFSRKLSLMVVRVEHLGQINTEFGQASGDQAMCHSGDDCRRMLRTIDILARIGDAEFGILMPETPIEGASIVAERLRGRLDGCTLRSLSGESYSLSVRIAVVELMAHHQTEDMLLAEVYALLALPQAGGDASRHAPTGNSPQCAGSGKVAADLQPQREQT